MKLNKGPIRKGDSDPIGCFYESGSKFLRSGE